MSKNYDKLIKDPDAYLRKLFAVGWLDEWSDEEIALLTEALKNPENDPKWTVFALSEYSLDPEGFRSGDDYKLVLLDILKSFGIELDAESVESDSESAHLEVKLAKPDGSIADSVAVFDTEQPDDWMSDDFIDFINEELLADNERELFILPPADATAQIVFHYPQVIDAAIEEGIIPDDDYFFQ